MPKFTYVSRDHRGQRVTAVAEADSRHNLLGQLKERGLTVVEIRELHDGDAAKEASAYIRRRLPVGRATFSHISTAELAIFWREFATMVSAGLPVVDALESIAQELEHVKLRRVLTDVIAGMWEGFNLSQSIKKHPKTFSPMVVALIGAAEESGSLDEVSNQLATYLESRDRLIRKVRAALTYPVFLVCFFIVVMTVATFSIIPSSATSMKGSVPSCRG